MTHYDISLEIIQQLTLREEHSKVAYIHVEGVAFMLT
jgi:hypothetical protein